ncbi:ABC transporter permease [Leucobacter tenebrionis]|uniref:ABC transporter permease n=1 Tax=Leucobacter tenebrionis TaxID=2873270 RepID=UPI001CA6070C|nr:ABC transporter permease [Leucobacter tenebrionis]QZY51235.1 ABC transporter permease [Leucobacter tenebrionis]
MSSNKVHERGRGADLSLRIFGILVLLFLFAPLIVILFYSFNTGSLLGAWEGFGVTAYETAFNTPEILNAVGVSLRSSVVATLFATLLGSTLGMAIGLRTGAFVSAIVGLLGLVLVTPEIVQAVSLMPWLTSLSVDWGLALFNDGILRLAIGHSLFATAVVSFLVRGRVRALDPALTEAAEDLYASRWNSFRQILLPQLAPAIGAGALMAFTLSLDNTIISAFVQATGSTPWPVYVLSSLRSGLRPELAAMAAVMLIATLALLALAAAILARGGSAASTARALVGSE